MIDELKEENLRLREILLNFENRLQELEAKK
jgi:dynactin complex subunit